MCEKNEKIMKEQPKEQLHELSDETIEAVSGGGFDPSKVLETVKKQEEMEARLKK